MTLRSPIIIIKIRQSTLIVVSSDQSILHTPCEGHILWTSEGRYSGSTGASLPPLQHSSLPNPLDTYVGRSSKHLSFTLCRSLLAPGFSQPSKWNVRAPPATFANVLSTELYLNSSIAMFRCNRIFLTPLMSSLESIPMPVSKIYIDTNWQIFEVLLKSYTFYFTV